MLLLEFSDAIVLGGVLVSIVVSLWQSVPHSTFGTMLAQIFLLVLAFPGLDVLQLVYVPLGAWLALLALWHVLENTPSQITRLTGDIILGLAAVLTTHDITPMDSRLRDLAWSW